MPRRVLLVDDDITEIVAVKRVLREAGLQAVLATNASDAVAEVARTLPEVLVVASACESGEGALLARRFAAEEGTRDVPLLVLGERLEDLPAPAFPPPIDTAALSSEIEAALQRRAASARDQASGLRLQASVAPAAPDGARTSPDAPRPGPGPFGPSWRDGEALELAAEAEALRQRAEIEAARAEEPADAQRPRDADREPPDGSRTAARAAREEEPGLPRAVERAAAPDASEPALLAEILAGTTEATSVPRLLALAARGRATGRLEFATRPPRALWLEEGRVVGAESAAAGERTEAIALAAGLLTREQHRAAALAAGELGPRSVAALLAERGWVEGSATESLLRRRAEEVAFALFSEGVPFRFVQGETPPPEERISPIDIGALEARERRGAGPAPAQHSCLDAARLAEKEEQVRRADYFTILGVPRDATRQQIGQAADRLLAELASTRQGALPDGRLTDVRHVLEDARDVLLDDALRAAYAAALAE